jgi:predicted glycogen debranching enzyme
MLPNRFPDDSETPDYNTVDATMWYFEAISSYFNSTQDLPFLKEIYSKLENIIEHHLNGTRFHIKCDPNDGLLFAGQEGCQLTWMDAKIGNYVVTPRIGKTIEVNALWYNAIKNMEKFATILNQDNKKYSQLSNLIEQGFERFWNENLGYCYDVIDGPNGNDESLRPNQIIAVSLNYSPLNQYQKRNIIDICGKNLVSFFGVKSLSKNSHDYKNKYFGTPFERDCAYHQGTIWSWLLGNYAIAYYNVTLNASVAIGFLEPLEKHINEAGIGFISEIFDAESPYHPRGCIAQAWGVAETLRAWKFLSHKI